MHNVCYILLIFTSTSGVEVLSNKVASTLLFVFVFSLLQMHMQIKCYITINITTILIAYYEMAEIVE